MTIHRKNKVSNKSTGGNIKAGLVPSIGKQRLSRDKSLTKSVDNLTTDNKMFIPPKYNYNVKFSYYSDMTKINVITNEQLINMSINLFNKEWPNKFFCTFIITSPDNYSSVYIYNKPTSPYNFFSCTFYNNIHDHKFNNIKLIPGHISKIDIPNSFLYNITSIIFDFFIKTHMPYSQINLLPIEKQKMIQQSTNLLTGYKPINVWKYNVIDNHNLICNFLPKEAFGLYEFILNINKQFNLPNQNKLTIFTHKIIE